MEERRRVVRNLIKLDLELKKVLKKRLEVVEEAIDREEMSGEMDFYVDEKTRTELTGAHLLMGLKCDSKLVC